MANNSRINPMFADTASGARMVSDTTQVMISGVMCKPTNATWVVELQDGAGNVIFYADNVAAGAVMPPTVPFLVTGLVIGTLTNAEVFIHTTP